MIYTDKIHVVADTLEELHIFAQTVGISKNWYEGVRKGHPHYDIPKGKLEIILKSAIIVRPREILRLSKLLIKH